MRLLEPCAYCGEAIGDHTLSELKSCAMDIEARESQQEHDKQEQDAYDWWKAQQ